jgi:Sec-independent protein translocase protein TatA
MALRTLLLMTQGRQLVSLPSLLRALPTTAARAFGDHRSSFEDKEEALEKQFMYNQNKKTMEQFAEKVAEKERTQDAAKQELAEILGQSIPEDVMKKLFAWKEKHSKREFWMK